MATGEEFGRGREVGCSGQNDVNEDNGRVTRETGCICNEGKRYHRLGILGRVVATSLVAMHVSLDLPEKADYYNDYANRSRCGHTLDAPTYTLGEFVSLEATTSIRSPTINFLGVDGGTVCTDERHTADSLSVQGILKGGASASVHIYASTRPACH